MTVRSHDPLRLDVAAFAAEGGAIDGTWVLAELPRLAELQSLPADKPGAPPEVGTEAGTTRPVAWRARGESIARAGTETQVWLHLAARCTVSLGCQRCLQPMPVAIEVEPSIRFVPGESQAAALDAENEYDVLALTRSLDLRELIEDELLLALPPVPRHDRCPQPLTVADTEALPDAAPAAPAAHPFAALAALKPPGKT